MIYINETKGKDHPYKIKAYETRLWFARVMCIGFGTAFCVLGIVAMIVCISQNAYEPLGAAIPVLLFGPAFIFIGVFFKRVFRNVIERGMQNVAPVTRVTFEGNAFEITVPFNRKKSVRYQYSEVTVTEYPEVWVIELPDGGWNTLNKSDMVEGSAVGLSEFLSERLGERYTVGEETI